MENQRQAKGKVQHLILTMAQANTQGLSYMEIIKLAYESKYGQNTFNPITNRGYYSSIFRKKGWSKFGPQMWCSPSPVTGYAHICLTKSPGHFGKYKINSIGLNTLKQLNKKFKI